jgi:glycosyltransferase involved in cell wall biosynthesis
MIKVVHCITGLTGDGAQGMLLRLVADLAEHGVNNSVVSLQAREAMASSFEHIGVPVYSLGMNSIYGGAQGFAGLCRILCAEAPDILQGWMYHGNAALYLAQKMLPQRIPLIWNIRRGLDDLGERSWKTRGMIFINRMLSRGPSGIIYCTEQSMVQHEMLGFTRGKGVVIGNGFDTGRYRPRSDSRSLLASRLGLSADALVIGHVGRYDVAKGHRHLLEAFSQVSSLYPKARLVCAGRGVDESNSTLVALLQRLDLSSRTTLLGEYSPVEELYPAFDIMCSSSIAEGFPNVIAEAMASGVPCVVTDTGASRALVEGIGIVVEPRSSAALARGLSTLCAKSVVERRDMGVLSRQRVRDLHSMKVISQRYADLYKGLSDSDGNHARAGVNVPIADKARVV